MKSLSMCVKKPKKMRKLEKKVRMKRRKFISLYIFFLTLLKAHTEGPVRKRIESEKLIGGRKMFTFRFVYICVCV